MKTLHIFVFLLASVVLRAQTNEETLVKACLQGDLEAVKKAVDAGANPNGTAPNGARPLSSAYFWPEITQYLLDHGAKPNDGDSPALVMAARYYSVDVMKILLKAGADPNRPIVVKVDQGAAIRKLIEDEQAKGKKANKNLLKVWQGMLDKMGDGGSATSTTALFMVLSFTNCKPCAELLLDAGAKTDGLDAGGGTAIHTLAFGWMESSQRVDNIRKNMPTLDGLGVRVPDWYRNLDPAQYGTASDMIGLLKKAGVNILTPNKLQLTPLQLALSKEERVSSEVLLGLIDQGADVNEDFQKRGSIVVQAAAYGSPAVMEALIAKGVDINHEDVVTSGPESWKGFTALINAVKTNNFPTVKFLVEHGAKVTEGVHGTGTIYSYKTNTKCEGYEVKNKSVIFFAVETGNLELIKYLIEAKNLSWKNVKDMEYKEPKGMTHTGDGSKCFPFGIFSPPSYAKRLGLEDIQQYLKDANMGNSFFKK